MALRSYLIIALFVFFVAMTGSDIYARMTIGGWSFGQAVNGHLEWASMTVVGIFFLFAPFLAVAFICAAVNKRARTRSAATIFGAVVLVLLYYYFGGFQAAQQALLDKRWTAAALSVGLLPFFIGIPTVLAVVGLGALASTFDPQMSDQDAS